MACVLKKIAVKKQKVFMTKRKSIYKMRRYRLRDGLKDDFSIAMIIPTTSKGIKSKKIDDLVFFKTMLPSFKKTFSQKYIHNFYLGIDHDDEFLIQNQDRIKTKFKDFCGERDTMTILIFDKKVEKGDLSTMWSILAELSLKTSDYIYQLGDDIEFLTDNWEMILIQKLIENKNFGVTGPYQIGRRDRLITQSFVHQTHLSLFKRFFPKQLKNWYIDDWISEVYSKRCDGRVKIKNHSGNNPRYEISDDKSVKDGLVREGYKIKSLHREKTPIFIKGIENSFFLDDKHLLVVCQKLSNPMFEFSEKLSNPELLKISKFLNSRNICEKIRGKIVYKKYNWLIKEIDHNVVGNIENIRLEPSTDDIFLFQQFYVDKDPERYIETKEVLKLNLDLKKFKKVYLLNEKIYTGKEMGIDLEDYPELVQIDVKTRLTYKIFIDFVKKEKLKGFLALSNSDIFFDETIENVKTSHLHKTKAVQILFRHEFRGEKILKNCSQRDGEEAGSHDSWIFHSSSLEKISTEKFEFLLGRPNCELSFSTILVEKGFILLNSLKTIRTYHNHKNEKRTYLNDRGVVYEGPYTKILPSDNHKLWEEYYVDKLFWQYPVITEKKFFEQNKKNKNYFGIPWASIIDKKVDLDLKLIEKNVFLENGFTCCQHIHFRNIIPTLKKIGITTLYASHKKIGENIISGVLIKPCPLYAKIYEDDPEFFKDWGPQKYLYSFKGAYQKGYLTDIRKKIFSLKKTEKSFIVNTGDWHFNKIVYTSRQNRDQKYDLPDSHNQSEKDYRELLKTSVFTLCPSGSGPNSIRFWESLGAGSIPVLLCDTLELPHHELWENSIVRVPEKDIHKIPTILEKYEKEKLLEMRKNCKKIYNFFRNNYKGEK